MLYIITKFRAWCRRINRKLCATHLKCASKRSNFSQHKTASHLYADFLIKKTNALLKAGRVPNVCQAISFLIKSLNALFFWFSNLLAKALVTLWSWYQSALWYLWRYPGTAVIAWRRSRNLGACLFFTRSIERHRSQVKRSVVSHPLRGKLSAAHPLQ